MRQRSDPVRIARLKVRRVNDARRLGMTRGQRFQHRFTAAVRHLEIRDHQVIAELIERAEGLPGTPGRIDSKIGPATTKHSREGADDARVVVYQQNSRPTRHWKLEKGGRSLGTMNSGSARDAPTRVAANGRLFQPLSGRPAAGLARPSEPSIVPGAMVEPGIVTLAKIVGTLLLCMGIIPFVFLLAPGGRKEPTDTFDGD